jgi:hypothetical protein
LNEVLSCVVNELWAQDVRFCMRKSKRGLGFYSVRSQLWTGVKDIA